MYGAAAGVARASAKETPASSMSQMLVTGGRVAFWLPPELVGEPVDGSGAPCVAGLGEGARLADVRELELLVLVELPEAAAGAAREAPAGG
jgi:hypothetical protein